MKRDGLRILYVGDTASGSTSGQRLTAMRDLGHAVRAVPIGGSAPRPALSRIAQALVRRATGRHYDPRLAAALLRALRETPTDLVWIDKGLALGPGTLAKARSASPGLTIVGYSPDDMMNPANQSWEFLNALSVYDFFFTTKSYNVAELKGLGARRVVFVPNAFCPHLHRPVPVPPDEKARLGGSVGFIGTAERERAMSIARLAREGLAVKVWGDRWSTWAKRIDAPIAVAGPSQYGERYVRIICSFDVNLCFLRKENRDLQTQRSIEIPACGAFMLAERTDEHRELFEEGVEAEFFGSDDELVDKTRYYATHEEARRRVATAGRERCLRDGYSNHDRLRFMLSVVATS